MKRVAWLLTFVPAGGCRSWRDSAGSRCAPPLLPHRPISFTTSFRLLLERNIFDASRSPYVSHPSTISSITTTPQNMLTLTGLVEEGDAYSAFIENSGTNTTTKYKIGDTVAGGKIIAAGMDYLDLATARHASYWPRPDHVRHEPHGQHQPHDGTFGK